MSNPSGIVPLTEDRCSVECVHPERIAPLLGRIVDGVDAERLASVFGTLADPTRARIVQALDGARDELCVCDLALLLGISESALSHQLRLLRERGVVTRRRAGRLVYYRLADDHVRALLAQGLAHAGEGARAAVPA
jgi:ArsR family transcriptional regulator